MINTAIGEIGVTHNGKVYLFRPSFYALSKVSQVSDPISVYQSLTVAKAKLSDLNLLTLEEMLNAAIVMQACSVDGEDTVLDLIGCSIDSPFDGSIKYKIGFIEMHDLIILAGNLIKNALIGKPKKKYTGSSDESVCIDASEFVGCAMSLGVSKNEAWQMTMIELQRLIESKTAGQEKPKVSKSSYEKMVAAENKRLAK